MCINSNVKSLTGNYNNYINSLNTSIIGLEPFKDFSGSLSGFYISGNSKIISLSISIDLAPNVIPKMQLVHIDDSFSHDVRVLAKLKSANTNRPISLKSNGTNGIKDFFIGPVLIQSVKNNTLITGWFSCFHKVSEPDSLYVGIIEKMISSVYNVPYKVQLSATREIY